MAETQPTGEQIRFRSANTGDHVLDTYLESAEIGGRSLTDLLDDLFDPSNSGTFRASNFEFRFDPSTDKLQFRVGQFASSTAGFTDLTTFFSIEGTFSTSTTYNNFDVVTLANKDVYIVHGLSSGTTFSSESNFTSSANTEKLVDVSGAQDWASKVNGIVDSTDYSAKAYAIGGTGVDTTTGSAKDWATKTGSAVGNTSDFSAKHYATTGNVATVASSIANINTTAAAIANVNTTAANIANVNTVAGVSSNVTTVAGVSSEVTTLSASANITNMSTLAPVAANIATVAGISSNVTSVAGISSNVTTVAGIASNVTSVAGVSSHVSTVAGIDTDVTAVSNIASNVTSVAGIASNVTTVAGISANVTTAATNNANITTVATNIADVNSFANTYFIGTSAPTGSNVGTGDLWYDSGTTTLKSYNGSAWVAVTPSNTDSLSEGSSNLYYTNARVETYVSNGSSTPVFASGTSSGAWHVDSLTGPATLIIDPTAIGDDTGTVRIRGNLQVDGTQTQINSTTLDVADLNITVANGAGSASAANGAGLTVGGANATLTYVSASDTFAFNKNVTAAGATLTTSDEATALAIALG